MMRFRQILVFLALFFVFFQTAQAQSDSPLVLVLNADGVVAPAMKEYIVRGIKTAEQRDAEALIIQLNTPGGLISEMEEIVQAIRGSNVPVVVYVTPRGGTAGSAGAVITLAGHAAAMAPETIIGAASPISGEGQDLGETLERKQKEALRAQVRTLTERRSAEATSLAEDMIEIAKAVSVKEASEVGLIDFVADDLDSLLTQLDGFEVQMADGPRKLDTSNARAQDLGMSFIEQLLDILVNPNITFLLVTIGVQAILIEISSPGGWVAGFIGVVCLALAAYGLGVLPVNWFGGVFLVLAFVLFVLDVKMPTHGALTAAGVGSFIVGGLVLFNSPGVPQFQQVSIPLVVGSGIFSGLAFAVIIGFAIRAQRMPKLMGQEVLVGAVGTALSEIAPHGQVQVRSEQWSAELVAGESHIQSGQAVEVMAVEGLRLKVRQKR